MRVVPLVFAQLTFPLVLCLAAEKPAPSLDTWAPAADDLIEVLRQHDSTEELEAVDRHELLVSLAALKVPSKARKLYEKGLEAQRRGDFVKALKNFRAALKAYSGFAAARAAEGKILLWQKKRAEAQEAFLKAIALDPDTFMAQLGLGLILTGSGHFEQAIERLQKALYLNGECWQVRYALGRAYYGSGEYQQAETNLKCAVGWKPNHANVYLLLALVLLLEHKPAEALNPMEAFLSVAPGDPLAAQVRAKVEEFREAGAE